MLRPHGFHGKKGRMFKVAVGYWHEFEATLVEVNTPSPS